MASWVGDVVVMLWGCFKCSVILPRLGLGGGGLVRRNLSFGDKSGQIWNIWDPALPSKHINYSLAVNCSTKKREYVGTLLGITIKVQCITQMIIFYVLFWQVKKTAGLYRSVLLFYHQLVLVSSKLSLEIFSEEQLIHFLPSYQFRQVHRRRRPQLKEILPIHKIFSWKII